MLNTAFCITCGEYIAPKVKEVNCTCIFNGVSVEYKELVGQCVKCQNEVYTPVINDANVERRLKARQKCIDISKAELFKNEFTEEDAIKFWEEDDSNG